jgi:hypothetical protein
MEMFSETFTTLPQTNVNLLVRNSSKFPVRVRVRTADTQNEKLQLETWEGLQLKGGGFFKFPASERFLCY